MENTKFVKRCCDRNLKQTVGCDKCKTKLCEFCQRLSVDCLKCCLHICYNCRSEKDGDRCKGCEET